MARPSGLPVVDDEALKSILLAVVEIGPRGRLNILPRWRARLSWLSDSTGATALMVLEEPGLLSIRNWEPDGPRVQQRFAELLESSDPDAERAALVVLNRYQRLVIPARERASLGDAALAHLGLPLDRKARSVAYVGIVSDRLDVMSKAFRDSIEQEGHPLLDDLP